MTQLLLTTPLNKIYGYTELREKLFQHVIGGENSSDQNIDESIKDYEDELLLLSLDIHKFISDNIPMFCTTVDSSVLKFDEFGCLRIQLGDDVKYQTNSPLSQSEEKCTPTEISMCASIACLCWYCELKDGELSDEVHNMLIYWSERLKQVKSDSYEKVEGFNAISVTTIIN